MTKLRSINQDDLRNHNLSVVMDTLLRSTSFLSRAELAKATGLTKATMSLLVPLLIDGGVVKEGEPSSLPSNGRPSTPLMLAGGRLCGIGMQVNTDGFGCMALDINGDKVGEEWESQPMSSVDPGDIFSRLDSMLASLQGTLDDRGYQVTGSGLALPGLVTDDGRLMAARNLGWERLDLDEFPVVRRLSPKAGNEANFAALAQIPGYATRRTSGGIVGPTDSFIYISTDVGIGGALVRDGHVVYGDHGFAGELGHVSVDIDGPLCHCGRHGCLETYAGRKALVKSAGIASGDQSARIEAVDELIKRWNAGDEASMTTVDMAVEAMASVVASAVNILDVDTVVLGGIWEKFGGGLARRIEDRSRTQVLGYPESQVHVLLPDRTMRPALWGAAEIGLRAFIDNPLEYLTARS
ncbi:ROK family protein [uncultured Bifidobacterium sp.]|uniref:ROK family protein n=1 Tax=uncultured Bifidobacterium sp. TaxID=165187 RepID=UPI002608B1A1|nr:ROK family protein [uncultured Bifidobacterium sp.]